MIAAPAFIKAVPGWVWALMAFSLLLGGVYTVGRVHGKAACEARMVSADKKADAKAAKAAAAANEKAETVTGLVTKDTENATETVRTIIRTLPATCPALPAELRELVQRQVEATRLAMPATPRHAD